MTEDYMKSKLILGLNSKKGNIKEGLNNEFLNKLEEK